MKTKKFTISYLSALVSVTLSLPLYASFMRDDIDLQYYRDFAENKGKFTPGERNIEILNKDGKSLGNLFPHIPMPDLSAANRNTGVATLINPQYIVSVAHNTNYNTVQFGAFGSNPDAHHYTYKVVDRNDYEKVEGGRHHDYHVPRLNKLVTEVVPAAVTTAGNDAAAYHDSSRFTHFVRLGSGRQTTKSIEHKHTPIVGSYQFLTGGVHLGVVDKNAGHWLHFRGKDLVSSPYGALATFGTRGDSGSGVYAYDNLEKRWVLVGTYTFGTPSDNYFNRIGIIRQDYHDKQFAEDIAGTLNNTQPNAVFEWQAAGNASTIATATQRLAVPLADRTIKDNSHSPLGYGGIRQLQLPQDNTGKTANISGQDLTIVLKSDIDQGAGALNFNANATVRPEQDQTWLGAGIVVAKDKQVNWQVKNPKGDRLSKLGEGTLHINGKGENLGDISVGQGTVILNQQADANGKKSAFNQVGIVSGRSTVVLNSADQVNPNNIYFGFRGGRLDLNGNRIVFNHIQNSDDGAKIVNSAKNTAGLTISPSQNATFNGFIGETDSTKPNGRLNVIFNPTTDKPLFSAKDIVWGRGLVTGADIYLFTNPHNKVREYFALKGDPKQPVSHGQSNEHWTLLSNNYQQAINMALARKNAPAEQSKLNTIYTISGGLNLNGDLNSEGGKLLLSGRPTPHAYDTLGKKDVVYADDWQNRQFKANNINLSQFAQLYVGRNVTEVRANFTAKDSTQLHLGFINGVTPSCYYSEYSGNTHCETQAMVSDEVFANLPTTQIKGNINLVDQSELHLGKTHLSGNIQASDSTSIHLTKQATWNNTGDSRIGHLTAEQGATINLNENFASAGIPSRFNKLIIDGNVKGNVKLNYLTDVGAKQSDQVQINGIAEGTFTLALRNSGKEVASVSPISLLQLTHHEQGDKAKVTLEKGYVDLGAYRYVLANRHNDYRLYNPLKEAEERHKTVAEQATILNQALQEAEQQRQEVERLNRQMNNQRQTEQAAQSALNDAKNKLNEANSELNRLKQHANYYRLYYPSYANQLQGQIASSQQKVEQAKKLLNQANHNAKSAASQVKNAEQAVENAQKLAKQLEEKIASLGNAEQARMELNAEALKLCQASGANCEVFETHSDEITSNIVQNEWISQYANTALSELSAQVNASLQIGQNIDRQLFNMSKRFNVWSSHEHQQTEHKSAQYRPYKQQANLTQIGVELPLNDNITSGIILSQNRTNTEFDQEVNGKSSILMANLYAKWKHENGIFVGIDAGYGEAKNRIALFGDNRFERHIGAVGTTLGHQFSWGGIQFAPSIGTRYYRLSGKNYGLGAVDVVSPRTELITYQGGLNLSKPMQFNDWHIEPSLALHYVDANHNGFAVKVNQQTFEQQFGRYTKAEAKLALQHQEWHIGLHAGQLNGNEIEKQRFIGAKLGRSW